MLNEVDSAHLSKLIKDVQEFSIEKMLGTIRKWHTEDLDPCYLAVIADNCSVHHGGILVFPDAIEDVTDFLRSLGLEVRAPIPSVVVRERLSRRYGIAQDTLDVSILHARIQNHSGNYLGIEVFCLLRGTAQDVSPPMVVREREQNNEAHFAIDVKHADTRTLNTICEVLRNKFSMRADGGGYNPHGDAEYGGRSILYFSLPSRGRLELTCIGDYPHVVASHVSHVPDFPRELLSMLSGHWAARAVYVAARLGIADIIADGASIASEVARRAECDPVAMTRLLRYLTQLHVVRFNRRSGYSLDGVGELLRSDNSFRDLVCLYGEEFHEAWGNLLSSIRTGGSAFGQTFGMEHFEYFSRNPEAARKFDSSMSAVTKLVANEICVAFDFSTSATVVDVGGGEGTLLRAVLRWNLGVSGVLVDRVHVLERVLVDADLTGRLVTVPSNFFEDIPAGHDVYILSRVLHDWNDDDCGQILRVCRTACHQNATLLVLERILPRDGSSSLAVPWDIQMLTVTGGRERTEDEYSRLLLKAGFEIHEIRSLPLDIKLVVARPT